MTEAMPKVLPQYVFRERTRHGRSVYYFRKGKGQRLRLPDFGTPEFDERYHAALINLEPPKRATGASGSIAWLIQRYRETAAYRGLSAATRRQRENIFAGVIKTAGTVPCKAVTRKKIIQGREDRAATPNQARHFLDAMRGLFRWAVESDLVSEDPTVSVKNPPRSTGDGFKAWTVDDVHTYEARWPAGTKERVWLHVLLYTGLRRGDAVLLGRQHVRDGVATLSTEKTGTEVSITIRPQLARTLKAGPTGDLAFIVGVNRQPLTKESFGNVFREACTAAGVEKSAHGLRKLAATIAAEAGATVNELEALFGWEGGQMASHYTKKADRKRLAKRAGDKMENANRPHLADERPAPKKSLR